VVGPLLRREVRETDPSHGEHVLVYLNKGAAQFTPAVHEALAGLPCPVCIYGLGHRPPEGNLTFRPVANMPFVHDLASCRALISTAGNQLIGEAVYFGKPTLAIPEKTVEQRLNAAAIERMGVGRSIRLQDISTAVLAEFLAHEDAYRDSIRNASCDGLPQTVEMIERFLGELTTSPAPALVTQQSGI
jgi:uncharacterized protein (TIGR00661 family)